MRLATWNINSVRLRIDLVTGFLRDHDIDVLCLQETKTEDQHFPADALTEAGWPHQVYRGEKSYNGVAIVSRMPLSDGTTATGELHLRRPHQMKIIYDIDEPLILLTTPVWLHVDRPDDKRVTSYPISETPLSLILQEQVELRSDEFNTSHSVRNGITRIVLTKDTGEGAGRLTLEFTNKPFVLRKWSIRDAADVTTTVTLQNMKFGHSYENKFFAKTIYLDENQ